MTATLHLVSDTLSEADQQSWLADQIADMFREECRFPVLKYHVEIIKYFLSAGNEPALLITLVSYTASAFRPSFRYFEQVLRNLNKSGIFTLEAYYQRGEECRQKYLKTASLHYI